MHFFVLHVLRQIALGFPDFGTFVPIAFAVTRIPLTRPSFHGEAVRALDALGSACGIPGATVELIRLASTTQRQNIDFQALDGKAAHVSTTDAQGRFRIENVHEGAYAVRYYSAEFWGRAPGVPFNARVIQVTARCSFPTSACH